MVGTCRVNVRINNFAYYSMIYLPSPVGLVEATLDFSVSKPSRVPMDFSVNKIKFIYVLDVLKIVKENIIRKKQRWNCKLSRKEISFLDMALTTPLNIFKDLRDKRSASMSTFG